ncbi:MAG: DUF1648 domain-containing protein [Candidatus Aenigmatarchaeota archaeon]
MRKVYILSLLIVLTSLMTSLYFYPIMPDELASHWNAQGEVDGYMSKFWGLFLMPIVSVALMTMFVIIPKIDPLKKNIKKFRSYFDIFALVTIVFMFYIYLLTIIWNLGIRFDMSQLIIPPIGLLLFCAGVLTEKSEMNWFIGIKTPWTLSDERVWKKTNKLGGKIFKVSGIIATISILIPVYSIFLVLLPIIVGSIYLVLYSYFQYIRLNRGNMKRRRNN